MEKNLKNKKDKHKIREKFRSEVFKRDGYKCRVCGRSDVKLDAHHIEDRNLLLNGGYIKENGISLCDVEGGCHMKAERFHITKGKDWVEGYHPMELFKLIGSNLGLAIKKSEEL